MEKGRLPSFSEFLGGNVQRATPTRCRPCCPIDREEDTSAQKKPLDCLYVHNCREVIRTRLPREETYSPRKKPRSMHPLLFSIQCSMVYEYQRAVDWLFRVTTGGPSWGISREFLGKSAHVLASSHFLSPSQHDAPFRTHQDENIMLKGEGGAVEAPCRCVCNAGDFRGFETPRIRARQGKPLRIRVASSTHSRTPSKSVIDRL